MRACVRACVQDPGERSHDAAPRHLEKPGSEIQTTRERAAGRPDTQSPLAVAPSARVVLPVVQLVQSLVLAKVVPPPDQEPLAHIVHVSPP